MKNMEENIMFNIIHLLGRLTANPETRQTQNGKVVCSFTVAVDRPKNNGGGQTADFIKCICWSKTADFVSRYFVKGKPIMVTGRLQNSDYTDKNNIKHYSYVVLVSEVSFVPSDTTQVQFQQKNYQPNNYSNPQTYVQYYPSQEYPPLPSETGELVGNMLSEDEIPF